MTSGFGSIAAVRKALDEGTTSSVELVERAVETEDPLGVFLTRFDEQALAAAERADAARASGVSSPLLGVPVAVKDILSTVEGETTAQSLVLDREWGRNDAGCVARLRTAGAIVIGKTTTMEFAFGSPDETKPFPIPRNPWSPAHWTGGSSSGSAAGVAAGLFAGAVGTDTAASIRMPAALCGVTGHKPTFGLVGRSGCVPLAWSLDHIGPIARTAEDCAVMLQVMAGHDPGDPSSVDVAQGGFGERLGKDLRGVRIGVDQLSRYAGGDQDSGLPGLFEGFVSSLQDCGADVVPIELPAYEELTTVCLLTLLGEGLAYHTPDLRGRWEDYFASTRAGLALGAFVGAGDYVHAQRVRRSILTELARLFSRVELIATPTVSRAAPLLAEIDSYLEPFFAVRDISFHTGYWNATGHPAISVPIGFTAAGLPLAAQLIGRPFEDATVLGAADAFQRVTDWHTCRPPDHAAQPFEPARAAETPHEPATNNDPAGAVIRMHRFGPNLSELSALRVGGALVREHVDRLHAFEGARYESPALSFAAGAML
jgi:aspartyl-tRNA(Asn)/glutamyl-tRNA(Gln) amidotransferase subunit A